MQIAVWIAYKNCFSMVIESLYQKNTSVGEFLIEISNRNLLRVRLQFEVFNCYSLLVISFNLNSSASSDR